MPNYIMLNPDSKLQIENVIIGLISSFPVEEREQF